MTAVNRRLAAAERSSLEFAVNLEGPLDAGLSLEVFRRTGDDFIDRWDGHRLLRTVPVEEASLPYACRVKGSVERPSLRMTVTDPVHRRAVEQAVRAAFVPAPPGFAALCRRDAVIRRLNRAFPGLRPVLQHDLLTALVRCISAQQVNLQWAATTRRRLAEAFGIRQEIGGDAVYSLSAERLASASVAQVRALQFTTRKAEYLIGAAEAVANQRLTLAALKGLPDDEAIARLTALRGLGVWTAEWVLARTLGRPRVVAGDLGLRKAVGLAYLNTRLPDEREVRQATAHWGDSAGVAQQLLLHALTVHPSPLDWRGSQCGEEPNSLPAQIPPSLDLKRGDAAPLGRAQHW
jgi:DNA-3-methyladenine glycosylase II